MCVEQSRTHNLARGCLEQKRTHNLASGRVEEKRTHDLARGCVEEMRTHTLARSIVELCYDDTTTDGFKMSLTRLESSLGMVFQALPDSVVLWDVPPRLILSRNHRLIKLTIMRFESGLHATSDETDIALQICSSHFLLFFCIYFSSGLLFHFLTFSVNII